MEFDTSRMISLNGSNWQLWKRRMVDLLYCNDMHAPILGESSKPETMSKQDWDLLNRKVVGHIRLWVDDSLYNYISNETSAYSLWKKLEELYERKTNEDKLFLVRRLINLRYEEGTSMGSHLSEMQGIMNRLSSMQIVLEDELQALLVLSSLPDNRVKLVESLNNNSGSEKLSVDMVKSSLLNEEAMRMALGSLAIESDVLITNNRGRNRQRRDIQCYYCKKMGHKKVECRKWKKEQRNDN